MRNKLLGITLALVIALFLGCFASCSCTGCNGCGKQNELKSETGITLTGGDFARGARLVTEKLNNTAEKVSKALELLPKECEALAETEIAAIDISVFSDGVKVQPNGKVKVTVPAPLKDVVKYSVYHVKNDSEAEKLDCETKDGKVTFETDSFSVFVFTDSEKEGVKHVVKVAGTGEGSVNFKAFRLFSQIKYNLQKGEEQEFYVSKAVDLTLNAEPVRDVSTFVGWFNSIDGVMEAEPFSTDKQIRVYVEEERNIVAVFATDFTGVYQIWNFPGLSGMPVGFSDGRVARSVYVRPNSDMKIDVSALVLKALKRDIFGKMLFVTVSPEDYVVEGLDKIDYDKEGTYVVTYALKHDETITTSISVNVSADNAERVARASNGGKFYVGDDSVNTIDYKNFLEVPVTEECEVTAIADDKHYFDGWYEYEEGGIVGNLVSDKPTYVFAPNAGDFKIIAMFKIKPAYSNLKGVYALGLFPGQSNIPVGEKEEIVSELHYKPGAPVIDLLKVEVRGLRRTADDKNLEFVKLNYGDYVIDYDGLDFHKDGSYFVRYKVPDTTIDALLRIYVSANHAYLTVEFEGNGSLKVERYDEGILTESGVQYKLNYFVTYDFRTVTALPADGYKFVGWYVADDNGVFGEEPFLTDTTYIFKQTGKDVRVKAVFAEIITGLTVTCEGFENNNFNYNLKEKAKPDLEKIVVKSDTGKVMDASVYIVDASAVDYTKTGEHQIVVTYKYDRSISAILTVTVPQAQTYSYVERDQTGGINGVIKKNGEVVVHTPDGYEKFLDLGSTLTLTAEPAQGYKFVGWFVNHSINDEKKFYSANTTETFTVTDDTYIYARFAEKDKVTLTVIAGENGNVYYNSVGYSTPEKQLKFVVAEGSSVQVSASGATAYFNFVGWYDGEDETAALISKKDVYEFTVTKDTVVYARFDYAFFVTARIESDGAGEFVGEGITENGFYVDNLPYNANVTVEVKPNAGYSFIGWFPASDSEGYVADALISSKLKYTFNVSEKTGNVHLTALFRATVTEVKLEETEDFGLRIVDGKPVTEYVMELNQQIFFDYEGHPLLGKTGETYQRLIRGLEYAVESDIDLSKAGTYTITYTYLANPELKATITVKVIETGYFIARPDSYEGGRITENGQTAVFGNGRVVEKGTQITLTAEANEGYNFVGWYYYNEDLPETFITDEATHVFTVSGTMRVLAKFVQKEMYNFHAYVNPYDAGRITENGQVVEFANGRMVEKGTQITLTAEANEGYRFVGWYKSADDQTEELISPDATYVFTVNDSTYVYAKFKKTETTN